MVDDEVICQTEQKLEEGKKRAIKILIENGHERVTQKVQIIPSDKITGDRKRGKLLALP